MSLDQIVEYLARWQDRNGSLPSRLNTGTAATLALLADLRAMRLSDEPIWPGWCPEPPDMHRERDELLAAHDALTERVKGRWSGYLGVLLSVDWYVDATLIPDAWTMEAA